MIPATIRVGLARTHRAWGIASAACAVSAVLLVAGQAAASVEWPAGRPPGIAPAADYHQRIAPTPQLQEGRP